MDSINVIYLALGFLAGLLAGVFIPLLYKKKGPELSEEEKKENALLAKEAEDLEKGY